MFCRRRNDRQNVCGHSRCHSTPGRHVQFSYPLETTSLPPFSPFVPLYSFSPLRYQYGDRFVQGPATPHHRMAQPRRGILRGGQPLSGIHPMSSMPGTPSSMYNPFRQSPAYTSAYRRNSLPSQTSWLPYQTHTPSFPTPPASIQTTFGPTFVVHTPATNTPQILTPTFSTEAPSLQQWNFPTGTLSWSPHPAPHPNIPAAQFWSSVNNNILRGLPPQTPWLCATPLGPLDPWRAVQVTGGWPLPGADPNWTPSCWSWPVTTTAWGVPAVPVWLAPCLIPNPANPDLPQIVWDVSQHPTRAQRITGAHIIIALSSQMNQQAIAPAIEEVHIAIHASYIQRLWGAIKVQKGSTILVWDILNAIYEYFQTPLRQSEVDYLQSLDPGNYDALVDAYVARCNITPALPGFEQSQGLKRVDLLGDQRAFWGLWISVDESTNCWHLNLGLVNVRPGQPV